jgi:hypothetical protein
MGIERKKVSDPRYEYVFSYHKKIIAVFRDKLINEPWILKGYIRDK